MDPYPPPRGVLEGKRERAFMSMGQRVRVSLFEPVRLYRECLQGLFSGAGTPILIGAGVVGAILLLRRGRSRVES